MPESQKKDPTTSALLSSSLFNTAHIDEQIKKDQEIRQQFIDKLKLAHERGEDISEYVWPYEWEFRKRPKPHHASNIISLADALDVCGQHFYGATWGSQDWYARNLEEIERWKPEDNLYRAYNFADKNKAADFTNRPEEEKGAFIRKQEIYSKLSSWLNQTAIEAFTLDDEGNKGAVPSNIWLSRDALDILDSGKVSEKSDGIPISDGNYIYLNKEQLENALNKENLPSETKKRKELKPKGITCPEGIWILEAVLLSDEKRYGEDAGKQKISDGVSRLIEVLITNPEIEAFTISSYGGEKEPIDRDYLRGRQPTKDFIRGFIPYSDGFHTSKEDGRFLFVNKEHFENYLTDRPIQEIPPIDEEGQAPDSYIPAYLELMLKAVKALNLTPDKRANMDDIISWLNENWPLGLEGKSERMIKSMATFLRRPEDKKGGNTAWK